MAVMPAFVGDPGSGGAVAGPDGFGNGQRIQLTAQQQSRPRRLTREHDRHAITTDAFNNAVWIETSEELDNSLRGTRNNFV